MKIYILADMEGVSGIRRPEQVQRDAGGNYEYGRRLMMADVNAAIEGCFAGGADVVVACDTHGGGGQLDLTQMDGRAVYEMPAGERMLMPALDKSFAGVILLGHHAKAGTAQAFLDHTMSSATWFEYRLNGQPLGEIGIEAAWAAHFCVPVIMVSGEQTACDEARRELGDVETAAVKWALCRNKARCLPPEQGHALVRAAAERAVKRLAKSKTAFKPFKPKLPATIELTFLRTDFCEQAQHCTDTVRVDGRTLRRKIKDLREVIWL